MPTVAPGQATRWTAAAGSKMLALALTAWLAHPPRGWSEDHVDLRHEYYGEDDHRITVDTLSLEVEASLTSSTIARARMVYDAISGASPTGLPPPAGSHQVPLKGLVEHREAVEVELSQRWGLSTFAPSFAYSIENDYESYGVGYTQSIDLNQKNTTISLGAAGAFDKIYPKFWLGRDEYKKSGDFLLGVNQVLGPRTVLTVNFSAGLADGYLSDPYKGIRFTSYPLPTALFPEHRPRDRVKEAGYVALKQYVAPWRGSAELEYRIYHDSFGVLSHTATLTWMQKVGTHLLLSPMLRFMQQGAADFYAPELPGDPTCPPGNPLCPDIPIPRYYSADYRLSDLQSWTMGLKATVLITDRWSVDAAYKRYVMRGTDTHTAQSAYPSANVVTAGLTFSF